jgi:hypothetical protein
MSNVTKHDRKEEWEGDDGEKAGVNLFVRRDAIRVHDRLESFCEFIGPLERRRSLVCAQLMQNWWDGRARFLLPTGYYIIKNKTMTINGDGYVCSPWHASEQAGSFQCHVWGTTPPQ